jgi:DHA2 family multidrug resistance protein
LTTNTAAASSRDPSQSPTVEETAGEAAASPRDAGLAAEQLSGAPLVLAVATLAFSNFMVMLDMTVTNVSSTNIAGGLAAAPHESTWVITSYAVAEAIMVPLTGWLATRFGAARVLVICTVAFGLLSALCGLAPSLGALVGFRVLQGLAGGPIMPITQTLMQRVVPPHMRPKTTALWAVTALVAPVMGPVVGGTLSDLAGWRWIFLINIPVSMALAIIALRTLPFRQVLVRKPIDFVGLGLLIVWVGALQIMLDKGEELDWFNSPFVVGLLVVMLVGLAAFLIWEFTDEHPIVDLRVFRHQGFSMACIVIAIAFAGMFSSTVLVPLWLQTNLGYNATWAGYTTSFNGVLAIGLSPIVALLIPRMDPRRLVTFGALWLAGVMLWRSTLTQGLTFGQLALPQLAQGVAMPFFFLPVFSLGMNSLPPQEVAAGAGLMTFVRTTAGAFAASITTTAWSNAATTTRAELVGRLHDVDGVSGSLQSLGLSLPQALQLIETAVQSQAVMVATDRVFGAIAFVLVLSTGAIWLIPRPKAPKAAPPAPH